MGCGKSTLGKQLAKQLGWDFVDSDTLIEQFAQMSIEDIFTHKGETYFRELESEVLQLISEKDNCVVATGGGMPCYFSNMEFINETGLSMYIKMDFKSLTNRIFHSKKQRPLTKNKSEEELQMYIKESLQKREEFYSQSKIIIEGLNLNYMDLLRAYENYKYN